MKKFTIIVFFILNFICSNIYGNGVSSDFIATTYNFPANYKNPAQIIDIKNLKVSFEYDTYKNIENLYNYSAGIYKNLGILYTGLLYNIISTKLEYLDGESNNFNKSTFNLFGSSTIQDNISVGITFSFPFIKSDNYKFKSIDISIGTIVNFGWINTGILLKNIYKVKKYNENQSEIVVGSSFLQVIDNIVVRIFSDIGYKDNIYYGVGIESQFFIYQDMWLALSGAYKKNFKFGFSIGYNFLLINYTLNLIREIGNENIISLSLNF